MMQPVPKDLVNKDLKEYLLPRNKIIFYGKQEVKEIEAYYKVRIGRTASGSYLVDGQLYMWQLKSLEDVVITDIPYYNYYLIEKGCGTRYFINKKDMGNFDSHLVFLGQAERIINQ
jgi:hypothetical protein